MTAGWRPVVPERAKVLSGGFGAKRLPKVFLAAAGVVLDTFRERQRLTHTARWLGFPRMRPGGGGQAANGHRILAPLACCLAVVGLVACGGAQGDPAVRVNGASITTAQVDHWMSVVAASASTNPGQPKFDTPRPPGYAACIAYLQKYPEFGSTTEPAGPSRAALKAKCEFEYSKESLKALYVLISFDWVSGEARELGVKLPAGELTKVLTLYEHHVFPNGDSFQGYLASMRQTPADVKMEIEQELLVVAVHRKLEAQPSMQRLTVQQRQLALDRFAQEYERRWKSRTDCQAGYVVPICRQYRAPKTPSKLVPNALPLTDLAAE